MPAGTRFSAGGNVFLSGAPGAQIDFTRRFQVELIVIFYLE
jgi:hypothetical protein